GRRRSGIAPVGPEQRGGWRGAAILFRAAKPGLAGGGKWLTRAIATRLRAAALTRRPALPADRPLGKAAWRGPFSSGRGPRAKRSQPSPFRPDAERPNSAWVARSCARIIGHETRHVGRDELLPEMLDHRRRPETTKVEVEIGMDGNEVADVDAGGSTPFVQPVRRIKTGGVVVAGNIETAP